MPLFDPPPVTLGAIIDAALIQAKKAWLDEYAKGRDRELWYLDHFRSVSVEATMPATGLVNLFVTVEGRHSWQTSTYTFSVRKVGAGKFAPDVKLA